VIVDDQDAREPLSRTVLCQSRNGPASTRRER
jgi:hypothetical protein